MNTILSLILFLIALGVLITIHEFGHFVAAKSFKVYCQDFSIGFGPKILKIGRLDPDEKKKSLIFIKRKNPKAETNFSLGCIPLGGYVAMLGEDNDEIIKEAPELKGRSLEDISLWKRFIVMFAGIFMNFLLAFIIFFISASCFEQKTPFKNVISVLDQTSINKTVTVDQEGLIPLSFTNPVVGDKQFSSCQTFKIYNAKDYLDKSNDYINGGVEYSASYLAAISPFNDPSKPIKIKGHEENNYALVFDASNFNFSNPDYANSLKVALTNKYIVNDNGNEYPIYLPKISNGKYEFYNFSGKEEIAPISVAFDVIDESESKEYSKGYLHIKVDEKGKFENFGFGVAILSYWNGLDSFSIAANKWWDSSTIIGKTLGSLFYSGETWSQIGGPVAIFSQTTNILNNYPFYIYLETWGIISVNLAIFNLLPFPGLDGWGILVTLIEGGVNAFKRPKFLREQKKQMKENNKNISEGIKEISIGEKPAPKQYSRWKIPPKIKNTVSYIGLILIFGMMAVIFLKDIIGLF